MGPILAAALEYRAAIIAESEVHDRWRAGSADGAEWHAARKARRDALARVHEVLGVTELVAKL